MRCVVKYPKSARKVNGAIVSAAALALKKACSERKGNELFIGSDSMKLIKKQKVGASITDSLANLSVIGIFQTVEDAVTELWGELGLDNITLKTKYNAIWVFTKSRVKILGNIAWNKEFHVVCFISSMTRATATVDIAIRNGSEELCAYARVELCVLDLQTERPGKLSVIGIGDEVAPELPEADITFTRFQNEELPEKGQVQVKYTGIDFSRHTNNIEYIRFILNTYSVRELEARPIREMEVSYRNQSFENDVLTICRGSFGEKDIFLLQKEDKVIVKSEVVF